MMNSPNLNYIHQLSGGDREFEKKFIRILKKEFPDDILTYLEAVKSKDPKKIIPMIQKIKQKFSILGMNEAYECSILYENDLLNENGKRHTSFLDYLQSARNFLNEL